jgi:hypothetical protein
MPLGHRVGPLEEPFLLDLDRVGDLFLQLQVYVPEKLTSKERVLYDQLRTPCGSPRHGGA